MHALETKEENSRAVNKFRERLHEIAHNLTDMEWGFPNGDRHIYPTYSIQTYLGEIQIGVPEFWNTTVPHLIRFTKEQGPPSPDVEINIPSEHNRKVSGVYVQSGNENWLCSRGSFTAFRGQIKRDFTLKHFEKWIIQIDDKNKPANVILVCSINSPKIADDIATFVAAVMELKKLYKERFLAQMPNATLSLPVKGDVGQEFEGFKTGGGGSRSEYEYLHGPLCNQLITYLKIVTNSNHSVFVHKNSNIDVGIFDNVSRTASAIFEVKTSALPSAQVYAAIGQLHYYKYVYGHLKTKLYLVLPLNGKSSKTEKFVESLNIYVVYGESGNFTFPNGMSLSKDL